VDEVWAVFIWNGWREEKATDEIHARDYNT
jgi:hypothetical protein